MDSIWLWPLVFVAILVAWPALRPFAARLFADQRSQALAEQPERIYLLRVSEPRWRHVEPREAAERQLAAAGFAEAGVYVVREMPDLTLGLHVHPGERAYAVLYDHPRSGFWTEFVTRYTDATLATFTSLDPTAVELPPGSVHVAAPSLSVAELWKRMLAGRPRKPMLECSRARAAQDFEQGYADSVAYHKRRTDAAGTEPEGHAQAA